MQWTWYSKEHIQWGAMAFVLSELCARPHSPECDREWDCVTTVYGGWKVGGNQDDESRIALWRAISRLMAKARYMREMQRTDPGRPAHAGRRAQRHDPAPCLPAAESLSHYPLTTRTSAWCTPSQQTTSSMPTPESSLSGLSSVPYIKEPSDALRRVLGTETLGPFIDLLPDWSWADDDGDTASLFAGTDLGSLRGCLDLLFARL
ncbi:hypothetical protein DL769_006111 [Monosporascus sp. CRB-8-3]|nr:hypothetical protein DL769_006111 [Monosporascus sp. CRB-8-3]